MNDPRFSDHPTRGLPRAHGGAPLTGRLRSEPEDFVVEEELGYTASGEGEHEFLTVRKRGRNTHDVARAIAQRIADARGGGGRGGGGARPRRRSEPVEPPAPSPEDRARRRAEIAPGP